MSSTKIRGIKDVGYPKLRSRHFLKNFISITKTTLSIRNPGQDQTTFFFFNHTVLLTGNITFALL